MSVIAFHGQFASGEVLKRDMGDPSWVDSYFDGYDLKQAVKSVKPGDIAVGYSKGGSFIGRLSYYCHLRGAVLYEAPLLKIDKVMGDFPVLWITNSYRRSPWRQREMEDTLGAWSENHHVTIMTGQGRHTRWVWGWPPIGHAWDQSLNGLIETWMKTIS